MKCKHPDWIWLGETDQATYEWCEICGAVRRNPEEGRLTILVPKGKK